MNETTQNMSSAVAQVDAAVRCFLDENDYEEAIAHARTANKYLNGLPVNESAMIEMAVKHTEILKRLKKPRPGMAKAWQRVQEQIRNEEDLDTEPKTEAVLNITCTALNLIQRGGAVTDELGRFLDYGRYNSPEMW